MNDILSAIGGSTAVRSAHFNDLSNETSRAKQSERSFPVMIYGSREPSGEAPARPLKTELLWRPRAGLDMRSPVLRRTLRCAQIISTEEHRNNTAKHVTDGRRRLNPRKTRMVPGKINRLVSSDACEGCFETTRSAQ
jgi:hypothetical protein